MMNKSRLQRATRLRISAVAHLLAFAALIISVPVAANAQKAPHYLIPRIKVPPTPMPAKPKHTEEMQMPDGMNVRPPPQTQSQLPGMQSQQSGTQIHSDLSMPSGMNVQPPPQAQSPLSGMQFQETAMPLQQQMSPVTPTSSQVCYTQIGACIVPYAGPCGCIASNGVQYPGRTQ